MDKYTAKLSYNELSKKDLIELLERAEGIIADLRHDNQKLFNMKCRQMSEIVHLRRQVETLRTFLKEKTCQNPNQ